MEESVELHRTGAGSEMFYRQNCLSQTLSGLLSGLNFSYLPPQYLTPNLTSSLLSLPAKQSESLQKSCIVLRYNALYSEP